MKFLVPLAVSAVTVFCISAGGALAGSDSLKAEIVKSMSLVENRRTPAIMRLEHQGGMPVMSGEVQEITIHAIDPALQDYQHIVPRMMDKPGEFVFTVTPQTSCGYRAWAELKGRDGVTHYAWADLAGAQDCKKKAGDHEPVMTDTVDMYKFTLDIAGGLLKAGQDNVVTVTVNDSKGRFVRELEPIEGAFAYMVGFYDDYKAIATSAPLDDAPTSWSDVAGPRLQFNIHPERDGYLKLFAKFRIDGREVVAHFSTNVGGLDEGMVSEDTFDPFAFEAQAKAEKEAESQAAEKKDDAKQDELDWILEQETQAIKHDEAKKAAEKLKEESKSKSLTDLYKGPGGSSSKDLYESDEEGLMDNMPKIQDVPEGMPDNPDDDFDSSPDDGGSY